MEQLYPEKYVVELRAAYSDFYHAMKQQGMQYYFNIIAARTTGKELSKELAERLIAFLPAPSEASVFQMIVIGQELARGLYTRWFCFGLEGEKAVSVAPENACGNKLVHLTVPSIAMIDKDIMEYREQESFGMELVCEMMRAGTFLRALFRTVQNGGNKKE